MYVSSMFYMSISMVSVDGIKRYRTSEICYTGIIQVRMTSSEGLKSTEKFAVSVQLS